MKEDIVETQWQRLKGPLRARWDRLSEDDLEDIHGDREILLGMLQEYYGLDREQSERELREWLETQRGVATAAARPAEDDRDAVGVAAFAAGGAAAGAAVGSLGGPVGAAVGAAVGGLAGGLAGTAVPDVDEAKEDAYWQASFQSAPYVDLAHDYKYYQPAYRFGWESYSRYGRRSFDEVDETLMREWDAGRGTSLQTWSEARDAARDAWERLSRQREAGPRKQPRRAAGTRLTTAAPAAKSHRTRAAGRPGRRRS